MSKYFPVELDMIQTCRPNNVEGALIVNYNNYFNNGDQVSQSLYCPHEEALGPYLPVEHTAKTLIRLGGCRG